MLRTLSVDLIVPEDETFPIKEEFQIVTKHDVFKIPIEAQVMKVDEFEEQ